MGLRHWCDQNDNLDSYGWVAHDGENFGIQEIKDRGLKLTTSFVKRLSGSHGGDWTARIKVEALQDPKSKKYVSLSERF